MLMPRHTITITLKPCRVRVTEIPRRRVRHICITNVTKISGSQAKECDTINTEFKLQAHGAHVPIGCVYFFHCCCAPCRLEKTCLDELLLHSAAPNWLFFFLLRRVDRRKLKNSVGTLVICFSARAIDG